MLSFLLVLLNRLRIYKRTEKGRSKKQSTPAKLTAATTLGFLCSIDCRQRTIALLLQKWIMCWSGYICRIKDWRFGIKKKIEFYQFVNTASFCATFTAPGSNLFHLFLKSDYHNIFGILIKYCCLNISAIDSLLLEYYTVKKSWPFSRPQPGCHWSNSSWAGII